MSERTWVLLGSLRDGILVTGLPAPTPLHTRCPQPGRCRGWRSPVPGVAESAGPSSPPAAARAVPSPTPREHLTAVTCGAATLRSPLAGPPPPLQLAAESCPSPGARAAPSAGPAPFSRGPSSGAGKSPQRRWKRATSWESCRLRSSSAMVLPGPRSNTATPMPSASTVPAAPALGGPDTRGGGRAGPGAPANRCAARVLAPPRARGRPGGRLHLARGTSALLALPAGSEGLGRSLASRRLATGRRRTGV